LPRVYLLHLNNPTLQALIFFSFTLSSTLILSLFPH
jgi:hypothetical protein